MNNEQQKLLSNRLSRVIGQLSSVKAGLDDGSAKSCTTVLNEIKAADKALKKFAEAYINAYLHECLASGKKDHSSLEKELQTALAAAFNM